MEVKVTRSYHAPHSLAMFHFHGSTREYGVVGRGDTSYIFMLCSCRLNKCSISYWQSIMNFNTIKQQIEMIIMKNRWLYSLLLVSIIYLVLFYFNFTAYIGDYFEEEKYGFCMHCNGSVICGTCKCARTVLHWIVKWWRLSLLHTLWIYSDSRIISNTFAYWRISTPFCSQS